MHSAQWQYYAEQYRLDLEEELDRRRDFAEYIMLFHNPEGVQKVKEHREYIESGKKAEVEAIFKGQVEKLFGKGLAIDKNINNMEVLPQENVHDEVVLKKSKSSRRHS